MFQKIETKKDELEETKWALTPDRAQLVSITR